MAGDPTRLISAGTPFAPSAQRENLISQMLRDWLQTSSRPKTPVLDPGPSGSTFLILNDSDETIPQYGALKFDATIINPADNLLEFKQRLTIRGQKPDHNLNDARLPFMVAQEAILPGGIGRCIADGLTIAKVDVLSEAHLFVEGTLSTDHLQTAATGAGIATILYKEQSGTGVMYCVIRIGSPSSNTVVEAGQGSGGCCCDEFNRISVPHLPPEISLLPEYYYFRPSNLICGCVPVEIAQAPVKLYPTTDANVWEQKHAPINLPAKCGTDEECERTVVWTWVLDVCEGKTVIWRSISGLTPGSWVWDKMSDTCGAPCSTDSEYPSELPSGPFEYVETGCIADDGTESPGHWEAGISNCECDVLVPPEFDGTVAGQTAETTCDGYVLGTAYWRLTKVPSLDYFGCDSTRLEFFIAGESVLTYNLQVRCGGRPFCDLATNTFKLLNCTPKCTSGPTIICLEPKIPGGVGTCNPCKDHKIPKKFMAYVSYPDGNDIGPYLIKASVSLTCSSDCFFTSETISNYPVSHMRFENGPGSIGAQFCAGHTANWATQTTDTTGLGFISGYTLDTDITTGEGCWQVLVYHNTFSNSHGYPPSPPDGSILYLYPIYGDDDE